MELYASRRLEYLRYLRERFDESFERLYPKSGLPKSLNAMNDIRE